MSARVLALVLLLPRLAVALASTLDMGSLALLTEVPILGTVRAAVFGALAGHMAIFRGGGVVGGDRGGR